MESLEATGAVSRWLLLCTHVLYDRMVRNLLDFKYSSWYTTFTISE